MKCVSLFAGAGGMDLGFIQAGHEVIWANDSWDEAVETYTRNLGPHIHCADLTDIDVSTIPAGDLLIGGFPCQGFSVANRKRHAGDTRNGLYLQFLRVLTGIKPPFFVAENVKGILSLDGGGVFARIKADFSAAGYTVRHAVLNAADYGVPQRRERVFIIGVRDTLRVRIPFPPPPTHCDPALASMLGLRPWVSVGEALRSIPDPDGPHELSNHEYTKYKLRFNGHQGHRRTDAARPAPTITARGDHRGGVVIHHHPNNARRLSAREAAVIQSFPLEYEFYGSKTSAYRQIANAVPPRLACAVGMCFPKNLSIPFHAQTVNDLLSDVAAPQQCRQ